MPEKELSSAALYGKGIFTTVAIADGVPFLWEKHWGRLSADATKIGIELSRHSGEATRRALAKEIANSGLTDGRARVFQAVYTDKALSSQCADCHNVHPDSPKRDFKAGDVMGGMLVTIPLPQ